MKNLLKFCLFLSIVFLLASCDDDKDAEKFSSNTVEQNKAIIEDTGLDFMAMLERMRETQTVEAFGNLIEVTESGTKGVAAFRDSRLFDVIQEYYNIANGTASTGDLFSAIVSCKQEDDDYESIQEYWDENVGTYTWNQSLGDWDIQLGGNSFIFKFPASDATNLNNATFTIYNYQGVVFDHPFDDEYTGDFPAGVKADLKVGTETLVTFVFGASYNSDGVPNAMAADLDIEEYKYEVDVTNNSEKITATYKMWENNDLIMSMSGGVEGLFTEANIDDNTEHFSETYTYVCDYYWNESLQQWIEVYCDDVDEWYEVEFEEIAHSAAAEFQLMNIALRGSIDIKGLTDEVREIEDDYDDEVIDEEEYSERIADELNKYLNLRLINLDNNEIMAKAEAYVVHDDYEWGDDYWVSFRLTFGDGSPIDMETYFEEGFDDFIDSLNDLLEDLADDYNIDYEPIEY
ncbi:MAG: hypothetical protein MUE74_02740 [Bacteroidales bacterium]|nr:hypothetical protein [Bacteroidales bacterium]